VPALPSSILEPLWVQVAALLPTRQVHHPLGCHRPRVPDRIVFGKLIQDLVFGCGYRRIADATCSATTLRRRRDEWIALGLAEQLRLLVLGAYDQLFGLELEHLAVDGCTTKAPCGGQVAGPSPVDRRKQGLKRSVAVEADGIPLAALPAPANQRDDGLLAVTLAAIGVVGPLPARPVVHLDAGYDYQPCRQVLAARGMVGQIATRGRPAPVQAGCRWVIERTHPGPTSTASCAGVPSGAGRCRVLAGAGQRHHRLWPAGPPCLDLLSLGRAPPPPPMTASWLRPYHPPQARERYTCSPIGAALNH
jgi:transposase